jgi:hypothetical protein
MKDKRRKWWEERAWKIEDMLLGPHMKEQRTAKRQKICY